MKRIFLFSFLGISCQVFSQFAIKGNINDDEGSPLVGANVYIENSFNGTVTDQNGNYEISLLTPGDYVVVFSYIGFQEQKKNVSLKDNYTLNIKMDPSSVMAEEVIVKAIRADEKDPVAQTTLHRKTIQEVYNGEHPIYVISELSPSVVTESESGTSFANYGTMRLRGLDQHRINITLNGVPLNDMIDHGVYFSNFTDIGNSFESIQIQRGVGTSSNGVASYAGSMNFESVNLKNLKAGAQIQMGYGSYNSSRINGQFNSGMIDDKWSFHGSYSRIFSEGYKDHTESNAYSFFFSGGYFGKRNIFKVNAFDARSQNGLGYVAVDPETAKNNPTVNLLDENDKDDFGQFFVQFQHLFSLNKRLNISSSLYLNGSGGDFLYGWTDSTGLTQINYPLTNRHYGIISNINYTGIKNLELNGGIHAYTFKRVNLEQMSPDFENPYYDESSQKDEISLFVKGAYKIQSLTLFGDIQYRYAILIINPDYNFSALQNIKDKDPLKDKWNFINPKFGLSYAFNGKTSVYGSIGITNREPRKVDIFGGFSLQDSAKCENLKQGIDFLHEKVTDYELGIKHNDNNISTQLNLFYMNFENGILESGETIEFGSKARSNVPNSFRTGVELSILTTPVSNLQFMAHGTYMKSEIKKIRFNGENNDTSGLKPVLSPEIIVNSTVSYTLLNSIQVSVTGKYVSESFLTIKNNTDITLPSYFILNGRLSAYIMKKHSFSLEVNNITSEKYFSKGEALDLNSDGEYDIPAYFTNAPVNLFATLTLRF